MTENYVEPSQEVLGEIMHDPSYGGRIAEEAANFDFAASMATIDMRDAEIPAAVRAIHDRHDLSSADKEALAFPLYTEARQLDAARRDLWLQRSFLEARAAAWQSDRTIVLKGTEPAAERLVAELRRNMPTEPQLFVTDSTFTHSLDPHSPPVVIEADQVIEVPVTAFVSAMSFYSWEGRGSAWKKDGRPSREVILDYASRQTDIPPVEDALAAVMSDGRVYLLTLNAHRVAAARLKGQETIGVHRLTVQRVVPGSVLDKVLGADEYNSSAV